MGQIDRARGGEPRVLNTTLLPPSEERWQSENAYGKTGQEGAPPTGIPRYHGRTEEGPYRSSWDHVLREVLAPSQIPIGEQHVPIREDEARLGERICRAVQWRRYYPRVERDDGHHRSQYDTVTKHLSGPERVSDEHPFPFFVSLEQLVPLADVGVSNPPELVYHSHLITSSMRLRYALNPDYEQMGENQRCHNHRQDEHMKEVHSDDRLRR